ncbi:MAG: hypothetical protein AAGB12_06020 [Pseudomonadota bacterium]
MKSLTKLLTLSFFLLSGVQVASANHGNSKFWIQNSTSDHLKIEIYVNNELLKTLYKDPNSGYTRREAANGDEGGYDHDYGFSSFIKSGKNETHEFLFRVYSIGGGFENLQSIYYIDHKYRRSSDGKRIFCNRKDTSLFGNFALTALTVDSYECNMHLNYER